MTTVMREKQWAEKYPALGTGPVPAAPYVSDERFALERDLVFRRCWLNVGRVDEVPEPGDYVVREIAVCKASILVIRGSDGIVRGFHNVCSHRGNRLVLDRRGSCPGSLYCHFHNWIYSDTGALIRVPDEENFFDLDKGAHGLAPVPTEIWAGFVFVHLDPQPAETLREYLGGVAERFDGCPFHETPLLQTYRLEERANWKVGLDAQNELYHFPFQHRLIAGGAFRTNDRKQCRYLDVTLYDRHSVWSCEYDPVAGLTPLKTALFSLRMKGRLARTPLMIGTFEFVTVFPNFAILVSRIGAAMSYITYHFWPLAVDRTVWETRFHFAPPASVRERLQQEYFKCLSRDTLLEDAATHENVHAGLAARARPHLVLQDNEVAIRHFHRVMENRIRLHRGG